MSLLRALTWLLLTVFVSLGSLMPDESQVYYCDCARYCKTRQEVSRTTKWRHDQTASNIRAARQSQSSASRGDSQAASGSGSSKRRLVNGEEEEDGREESSKRRRHEEGLAMDLDEVRLQWLLVLYRAALGTKCHTSLS